MEAGRLQDLLGLSEYFVTTFTFLDYFLALMRLGRHHRTAQISVYVPYDSGSVVSVVSVVIRQAASTMYNNTPWLDVASQMSARYIKKS